MNRLKISIIGIILSTILAQAIDEPIEYIKTIAPSKSDKENVWLNFRDHTKGKLFKIYIDDILVYTAKESKDGKKRVVALDVTKILPPAYFVYFSGYKLEVEIQDEKGVWKRHLIDKQYGIETDILTGDEFPVDYGNLEVRIKEVKAKTMPTLLQFLGYDKNKTWLKFKDNSNGDFFKILVNGQEHQAFPKKYKDTKKRNGKSRVFGLDLEKLTKEKSKYSYGISIGVIKDGKIINKSNSLNIQNDELKIFDNFGGESNFCKARDHDTTYCLRFYDTSRFLHTTDYDLMKNSQSVREKYEKNVKYSLVVNGKEITSFKKGKESNRVPNFIIENLKKNEEFTVKVKAYYNGSVMETKTHTLTQE